MVLREALTSGVDRIDASDCYRPHAANLTIVTKVGAKRGDDASWNPAISPDELKRAVDDNLENLGLQTLDVVNYR